MENMSNKDIQSPPDTCGGGYHSFNNGGRWSTLVNDLMRKKMDTMLEKNDGEYYNNFFYECFL